MPRRRTNEEFIKEIYDLVGNEYTFLEEYKSNKNKILCIHNKCNYEWKISPNHFFNGTRCPECANKLRNSGKIKTNKKFKDEVYSLVKDEYIFLEEYINNKTKILCRHNKCGYKWKIKPNEFLTGNRCPKCSGLIKKTNKEFLKEVYNEVGDEYTFLEKYINNNTPILCIHNICKHQWKIRPKNFLVQHHRCPECNGSKLKTNDQFIEAVKDLVGDEYTFLEPYISTNTKLLVIHNKCKNKYYVTPNKFLNEKNRCIKCSMKESRSEKSVLKFIKKIYKGKIINNDRKIINPYELDICLPKLKIAIEYCGLYWHSELYKSVNYHLNKLNLCKEKGIRLIQIFEDEWLNKKSIVKSKIKHILGLNRDLPKIYARKCYIKEIDSFKKNKFLNKYHIQGNDKSMINLGLFTVINSKKKLVAVMTFCKSRKGIGSNSIKDSIYELSRFATKRKFNIIGGFSKLLSYFKKNYQWNKIITYADLRWSSLDNLYKANGLTLDHINKPNYWYIPRTEAFNRYHRFNFRKNNLKKLFPEIYKDELTEKEIMLKAKYLRIYDCGTATYTLINI